MLNISAEHKKEHLYLEVYHYYRKLILEGRLLPGSKMPSLRKCAQELKLSRTTIENAYLLLAADGYIIARAQSGYYVTGIASKQHLLTPEKQDKDITPCLYDFASSGVDRESFRFDLWQRYIRSEQPFHGLQCERMHRLKLLFRQRPCIYSDKIKSKNCPPV